MAGAARQPLLWLVVALPLAAIVAGIWMIRLAGGAMDASPDAVKRLAQIQTMDDPRDRRAGELGVHATVEINAQGIAVHVNEAAVGDGRAPTLALIHATDANQDRRLVLTACGPRTWCSSEHPAGARWRLALTPASNAWRVVGTLELGTTAVALEPAWSPQ